jgi:hypothetical protein
MRKICSECFHSNLIYVEGRQRIGCLRERTLPDGKLLKPPRAGWESSIERLPQSPLDWRKAGDQCGPEAKNFKEATDAR